ncbi:DUF6879 family protein [Streptomyces sp. NRRL B-24572]|uniref:DUF6879 family protein n=1 Tax=Streptomyces sp. NRRL B-24572 TaxID=1962156 RepID=UPI000A37E7D2|nr:DUF6879 family protein [Streptomyces sp. NRRL B-24572]
MARQLRFTGTDSKIDGCPALHADEATGEIIVQGTPITDPADLAQLQLPTEDFWIFDSRIVALLRFDDEDNLLGVELITEPAAVVRYCVARDAAMHHAVPYDRFATQVAAAE